VRRKLNRTRQSANRTRRDLNGNTPRLGPKQDSRLGEVGGVAAPFDPTRPGGPISQGKNGRGGLTSQSTRDITIPIRNASIFQNSNQGGTSGLRAPQAVRLDSNFFLKNLSNAVRLDSNLGDLPTVFSRAPESHFFLNNLNNTMLSRQELTISEQVTPGQNKPITNTASPDGGGTSRETFISRLKSKYHTVKIIQENEWPNNTDCKEQLSPRKNESPLACFGTNIRSMVAPANAYSLNKFLEDHEPDILFLIETWHREGHQSSLPDRGYGVILSPLDDMRAGGVGIVFRKPLIVTPLFQEFHTRNLVIARLSSSQGEPIILMSFYIPPDHQRR